MKWLVLAIFILAQQPAKAPEGKRIAERDGAESAAHTKSTESNQTQSAQPTPTRAQGPVGEESQRSATTATNHAQTSSQQTPDVDRSTQQKLTWFTGVLAAVGVLQLVVMFLTWLVYRRQAGIMAHQAGEMTQQRVAMTGQLKAMEGQLKQMESAGSQTKALISRASDQASALRRSADALQLNARAAKVTALATQKAANAAKKSAEASLNSIDIIKSKERARIRIVVEPWMPFIGVPVVEYTIHLDGSTTAYIVNAAAMAYTDNTENLFIGITIPGGVMLPTSPTLQQSAPVWPDASFSQANIDEIGEGRSTVRFRGYIRYKDVFGDLHVTNFAYKWRVGWLTGPHVSGKPLMGVWEPEQDGETEAY
jgi:hypothetical protein